MSLNATVEAKKLEKYDFALEKQIRSWIAGLLPEHVDACNDGSLSLDALLKSGVILLELLRAIVPGKAPAPSKMKIAFKQMENIQNYLKACESAVGMQQTELFETLDLYEARNMPVVLAHLAVLKFLSEKYLKVSADSPTESSRPKPKVLAGPPPAEKKSPVVAPKFAVEQKKKVPDSPGKRPDKSGADVTSLADDVAAKEEFKFDTEVAAAVKKWLEQCLNVQMPDLISSIKSGVLLCKLLNKVKPKMIPKIYEGGVAYLQMENLDRYIKGCVELGMSGTELFETNDLVNEKNLSLVVTHLHALAMFIQKRADLRWTGPQIESVSSRSLFAATLIGGELADTPVQESPLTPEQADLLTWANFNIMRSGRVDMTISNLTTDVRTSVKLLFLVEQLLQAPSGVPYNRNPTHMWHAMQNASLLLRYISSQTFEKVEGVRAADVVLGNSAQIARLLAYLRDKFDLDFMFKGLLGPDIDVDAAGLADEDEMVEIELEEGEAVPDYLRTFIAATDLAEIDEEHSHTQQSTAADEKTSELDSEIPDEVSGESPGHHEPELHETADQLEHPPHEETPRRSSNASDHEKHHHHHGPDEKHVSPRVLEIPALPIPTEEKKSPRRKSSVGSAPRHSPTSSPRSPTGAGVNVSPRDQKETISRNAGESDGHRSPSRPRGASVKHSPHRITSAETAEAAKSHQEPAYTSPVEGEVTGGEATSPRPVLTPKTPEAGSEAADSTSQEEKPRSDSTSKPKRPRKSTDKPDSKITVTRTKSPRRTPAEGSSKKTGQKRKVTVYKTKAQAVAAAAQPVGKGRARAGSLSLSADQQKRVADAQATVRLRVAQELLKTEQNYVNSLSVLIDGFIDRARQEGILTAEEIVQVFANIEDIRAFSRQFESELFQLIENQKDTSGIADLLLQKSAAMEAVYEPFISNYNNFMVSLQFLRLKNPRLISLQAAFEDDLMKTTMYNVESFVIMPVQRIPRYALLLKDILKYTPKESPACLVFANAIQAIDQMLKQLNSKIDREQVEHLRRQVLIAQSIDPLIDILSAKRRYVGESALSIKRFKVIDSKKADDSRKRKSVFKKVDYMFIMSDVIVFCSSLQAKTEEQKQYSYVETVPTSELTIASNENALLSAGLSAKNPFKGDKKKQDCQFVFVRLRDGAPIEWWLAEQRTPAEKDAVCSVLRSCVPFSAQ